MGKKTFYSIYVIFFCLLFLYVKHPTFLVGFSFFTNFLLLSFFLVYNISFERVFSPFLSVTIVFQLLFFVVAPLIQIDDIVKHGFNGTGHFIQNFPLNESVCIRANIYILIFNIIFFLFYYLFSKRIQQRENSIKPKNLPITLLFLFIFCVIIFLVNINTVIFQYQNEFYKEAEMTSVSNYLFVQKFLFFIPLSGVILSYLYLIKSDRKSVNYKYVLFLLIGFLIILFILKNPLTEKRNALGPIYITLLFLFFRKFLNDNYKVVRFMFFVMILVFPLVTIITHSRYSLTQMIAKPVYLYHNIKYLSVTNAFNSLHYDAYPNFLATIDYRDNKTVTPGEQLACSVFFFVPRKIWKDKPETTGFLIGDYLIEKYKFNFNNLSNPYISEGYINFGFFGIILFAMGLAYIFYIMLKWLLSQDFLYSIFSFYFSIYLMYFLRGDLTNGIAFIVAFWLAVIFVPKVFISFINYYGKN